MNRLNSKTFKALVIFGVVAFLYRLYPATVVYELAPTDEYVQYIYVTHWIDTGKQYSPGFLPQLMTLVIVSIYNLSFKTVNLLWLCKSFNPLVGALTLIPFYYFCRELTTEDNALMATGLFAVCDMHFYRSAYFGQSETLGMLFMFCVLLFYVRQQYIWCAVSLICMFYAHIIPFMACAAFIALHFVVHKFTVKRFTITIGAILAVSFLIGGPMSSHQRMAQFLNISTFITFLSLDNIGVYSLGDLWLGVRLMLGSVILGLVTIYGYLKKPHREIPLTMFLVSLFGVGLTWIGYDAAVMAPTRIAPYVAMSLIAMFSMININRKSMVTGVLLLLMFMGPVLLGGISTNLWVYDAATKEEIEALNYLESSGLVDFSKTCLGEWFTDRGITPALWYKVQTSARIPMIIKHNITLAGEHIAAKQNALETSIVETPGNETSGEPSVPIFRYIFYSSRMERGGFILKYYPEHHRMIPIRQSIARPYIDPEKYKLIYEKDGVWVYERR